MSKTAHIISHTHWDREWYMNSKFVNEWLPPFFDGLFAMMEKEPEYRFVLDGQTSMLDDCYVELEKLGRSVDEFKERISKYAKQGRLVLGPYYLQPDWQLASDESLVRNMLIGKKMSNELGGHTITGWLLDNFGQISQAPQLHKQFGMKGIVVWRGVELDPFNLNSEFMWVGADGTKIPSGYLLSSYRNAMHLADYPEMIYDRIKNETEKIAPFATTGNVLLMNGYDQEMQPDDIMPYIRDGKADFGDFKVKQSTPDEYMSALIAGKGELQELSGALYSGRYISVFPGILSSRMYLKLLNDEAQRQLEQYAEPVSAMAAMFGCEYPHEKLEKSWKLLLKNQPHDSICGVSVDDVHTDMEDRYAETLKLSREVTDKSASAIASMVDTSTLSGAKSVFTIFNTLEFSRSCNVFIPVKEKNLKIIDNVKNVLDYQPCDNGIIVNVQLDAFGTKSIGLFEGESSNNIDSALSAENEFVSISFNQDGSLTVNDKVNNKTYYNVGVLEDSADNGDEYNYSFLTGDKTITTKGHNAEIEVVEDGSVRKVFKITREWAIPESLSDDRQERSSVSRILPVITYVTLNQNSPVVQFNTKIRNTCRDHRVRVLFPTDIESDVSYAQTQFDIVEHGIEPVMFDNSMIKDEVKRIIIGARECIPITQFPQRDFCAVSDGKVTAGVINKGLPEYEVLREKNTIALTLFRGQGWLARTDLNTRIGDAGPEMLTPDAQCIRDMEFSYGFCSLTGSSYKSNITNISTEVNCPALVIKNSIHSGNDISSLIKVDDKNIKVSAVKWSEDNTSLIIRLYNPKNETVTTNISFKEKVVSANIATPYEDNISVLNVDNNTISITLNSKEIVTLKIRLEISEINKNVLKEFKTWHGYNNNLDLSSYKLPMVVTEAEISSEEKRADEMEAKLNAKCKERDDFKKSLEVLSPSPSQKTKQAVLVMQAEAIRRASLEARLSAIFAREKFDEKLYGRNSEEFKAKQEALVEPLRKIALQLNYARIDKRVSEYITDYFTHQENLK